MVVGLLRGVRLGLWILRRNRLRQADSGPSRLFAEGFPLIVLVLCFLYPFVFVLTSFSIADFDLFGCVLASPASSAS